MCNPRYVCNTATTGINFAGAGAHLDVATQSSPKLWTQSWNTVLERMSTDGPPARCQQSVRASAAQLIQNLDKLLVDNWEFIVHPSSTSLLWEDKHFSIKVLANLNPTITNSHILYTFPCCLFGVFFYIVTWIMPFTVFYSTNSKHCRSRSI